MKKPGVTPALVILIFKLVSNQGDFNSFTGGIMIRLFNSE